MRDRYIEELINGVHKNIENTGWQVLGVPADDEPGISYTIGLTESYGHPEIIMSGLSVKFMHALLNDIGELIKTGSTFEHGQYANNIIRDSAVLFTEVSDENKAEYLRLSSLYYEGKSFKALQCVWADENEEYPQDSTDKQHYFSVESV
ncbi:MAG: DUF4262 domain-containing protein [Colwellia sp.]|nr:DUF4262 domain-containing protein [Colwellia sp.]